MGHTRCPTFFISYWTLANSCITGVIIGRPSLVVTRVLTEKRQSPVSYLICCLLRTNRLGRFHLPHAPGWVQAGQQGSTERNEESLAKVLRF